MTGFFGYSEELVSIEELKDAIKQIQKVPDDFLVDRISEVLAKMDIDKDGAIRLDDVLKVNYNFMIKIALQDKF
jgi:hypothetical protein